MATILAASVAETRGRATGSTFAVAAHMLKLVLMTILLGGCLDSVEDTEVTSTEESELAAETFSCTQQCTNGGFVTGYGSTADAAFQNMNVCVGGGGTIECWSSNDL